MMMLFARYAVSLVVLYYLIKKNPFYTTYPVLLPFMIAVFSVSNQNLNCVNNYSILQDDQIQQEDE
jgi:hypothetical protein